MARLGVALLIATVGCNDRQAAPPTPTQADGSASVSGSTDEARAITFPRGTFTPLLVGFGTADIYLTLDRCVKTVWSYHGCPETFPVEGRAELKRRCANVSGFRASACTQLGEFLIEGIGGPVDVDAGLAAMIDACHQAPSYCYALAEMLNPIDAKHGADYARLGCAGPPQRAPSACSELIRELAHPPAPWNFTIKSVSGKPGLAVGATCTLWAWADDHKDCHAKVVCGDQFVYDEHGGTIACNDGDPETGFDRYPSTTDLDPELRYDHIAGTMTIRDGIRGDQPAWQIAATAQK